LTCSLITDLSNINPNPNWLLFGDFNINMYNSEKLGGNPIDANLAVCFKNTIIVCNLQDLGYHGVPYTWANNHDPTTHIQSRLDRFLASNEWIQCYPNYNNKHLLKFKSNHCPILLEFSSGFYCRNKVKHTRKLEHVWLTDEQHQDIVKTNWIHSKGNIPDRLHDTLQALTVWGNKKFGDIPKKVKEPQAELQHLNSQCTRPGIIDNIRIKEKELDTLLEQVELWWSQRSRALWLNHGEKNTVFSPKSQPEEEKQQN